MDAIVKQEPDAKARAIGPRKRRTYEPQFKAKVVAQCLMPGASVSAIALSHGINANVIRKWLPQAHQPMPRAAVLLPVTIEHDASTATQPAIELSVHGATLRLPPGFAAQDLRSILQVLRSLP
ncbi:MAG: transposase [Burkholderiales bacterium]|nr:transposase [Burkholderiales bacterium]